MNRITAVLFSVLLFASASSQDSTPIEEVMNFSAGGSIGSGYGFDLGYGRHQWEGNKHVRGWDILGSIWVPYFGKRDPNGVGTDAPFAWWTKTGITEQMTGVSGGFRYCLGPVALGVLIDFVRIKRFQNWFSSPSSTTWNTSAGDETVTGIGAHAAVIVSRHVCITGYWSDRRKGMVGLMYIMP